MNPGRILRIAKWEVSRTLPSVTVEKHCSLSSFSAFSPPGLLLVLLADSAFPMTSTLLVCLRIPRTMMRYPQMTGLI